MSANVNPETGIRYGILAAHNIDQDWLWDMQNHGRDVHFEEAKAELWASIKRVCKDYMRDGDSDFVADQAVECLGENWEDDEPVYEFELQGVKGRTTWLGGAQMVWVFESPFTDTFKLCSPCIPGACDLNSPNPDGYVGYTVPPEWRIEP